jgi:hypothetical protein
VRQYRVLNELKITNHRHRRVHIAGAIVGKFLYYAINQPDSKNPICAERIFLSLMSDINIPVTFSDMFIGQYSLKSSDKNDTRYKLAKSYPCLRCFNAIKVSPMKAENYWITTGANNCIRASLNTIPVPTYCSRARCDVHNIYYHTLACPLCVSVLLKSVNIIDDIVDIIYKYFI